MLHDLKKDQKKLTYMSRRKKLISDEEAEDYLLSCLFGVKKEVILEFKNVSPSNENY